MQQNIININLGEKSYDITIESGLLSKADASISSVLSSKRVHVVTDENVSRTHLFDFVRGLVDAGIEVGQPIILPAGEKTKSFEQLHGLVSMCLDYGVDKDSTLIALGGGVIGDLTGFAASIIMGGINFIQVPTTLLAQVDSSIGGNVGVNIEQGKNLVGTLYQPEAVLMDTSVLRTLPRRQLLAGYSAVLKYALIDNADFFEWLDRRCSSVIECDHEVLQKAITTCCKAKMELAEQELLNLGQEFGYVLEVFSKYDGSCLHGEALGIGIVLTYELSYEQGLCSKDEYKRVLDHISDLGMMTNPPFRILGSQMFELMNKDEIDLVLAKGIGKAFVSKNFDKDILKVFLEKKFG